MPRGDKTGPSGMGPMIGRGAWFCAGAEIPVFAGDAPGRTAGWFSCLPRGGRGNRNRFHRNGLFGWQRGGADDGPIQTKDKEMETIKAEIQGFERAMEQIRSRLTELEKTS